MTYRTEFPDFPEADMPAMPEGFVDASWKNDSCPCFVSEAAGLTLFVDYADASSREFPETTRFSLVRQATDERLVDTDDWNAVLAAIAANEATNA